MRQIETDKHLRLELHGAGEATSTDGTFKRSVKNFALRARLHNFFFSREDSFLVCGPFERRLIERRKQQ